MAWSQGAHYLCGMPDNPRSPVPPGLPPPPPPLGPDRVPFVGYPDPRGRRGPASYGYAGSSRVRALRAAAPARAATAIAAGLTGVSLFLPWVTATVTTVDGGGGTLSRLSYAGNAFAKGLPHLWPSVVLISVAAVIFMCVRTGIYNRRAWFVVSTVVVAGSTYAAFRAETSRPAPTGEAGTAAVTTVVHADFQWGFTVTAVFAGVTLLLAVVGRAGR